MRIALAQLNPTVGDLAGNVQKILAMIEQAKSASASAVIFPEWGLVGCRAADLLRRREFIDHNLAALDQVADAARGIDVLVGYIEPHDGAGRGAFDAVAVLHEGAVTARYRKRRLSADGGWEEAQYLEPGPEEGNSRLVTLAGRTVAVSIGEEGWQSDEAGDEPSIRQAELLVNVSAAPFEIGGHEARLGRLAAWARRAERPLVHVNLVGGNDQLIFDGNSLALDARGEVIGQAKDFVEDLLLVELPAVEPVDATPEFSQESIGEADRMSPGRREIPTRGVESVHEALVLGIRDYARKCGFVSAVLGLSGGIDSALVAALAAAALGAENVVGVGLPSRYSSEHSLVDARQLAENFGMPFHVVPIDGPHSAFEQAVATVGVMGGLADENLQARSRGVILMAISNQFNHLLLTTGNNSESAVGYCTLYGDMCGGLAVLGDVPKTMVYELSHHINQRSGREMIPRNTIEKPPSAELKPGQTDQDSLPPYEVLDAILHRYIELEWSVAHLIAEGFDPVVVRRVVGLVQRSEFKRRQAAPVLKVTRRAFGVEWQMPIARRMTRVDQGAGTAATS